MNHCCLALPSNTAGREREREIDKERCGEGGREREEEEVEEEVEGRVALPAGVMTLMCFLFHPGMPNSKMEV